MSKVLIIEDEKAMGDLIALRFKVEGFEAEHVTSFKDAKEKLTSQGGYDIVLSDYLLPDGNLTDFLQDLKTKLPDHTTPVIVMTNYVEDLNMEKLKSLGVKDLVVKYQTVPAQMVAKVKQLMEGKKGAQTTST